MLELLAEDVYVTMIPVKPVARIYVYCMRQSPHIGYAQIGDGLLYAISGYG